MRNTKLTPGFIGGIIGLALGILVSFGANVAIRASYNQATSEFDSSREIDPLGLTYRSLLNQGSSPEVPFSQKVRLKKEAEIIEETIFEEIITVEPLDG